ncbi:cytochrome b-c1 complex subunit 9 [Armadillidium vulgare]|nr:cytochrome b-c1 complex subunit 9 [Armadillidium vulgare]
MAGFVTSIYNSVFRKTSTFVLAGAVGVFFFERAFDMLTDGLFEHINEGPNQVAKFLSSPCFLKKMRMGETLEGTLSTSMKKMTNEEEYASLTIELKRGGRVLSFVQFRQIS